MCGIKNTHSLLGTKKSLSIKKCKCWAEIRQWRMSAESVEHLYHIELIDFPIYIFKILLIKVQFHNINIQKNSKAVTEYMMSAMYFFPWRDREGGISDLSFSESQTKKLNEWSLQPPFHRLETRGLLLAHLSFYLSFQSLLSLFTAAFWLSLVEYFTINHIRLG